MSFFGVSKERGTQLFFRDDHKFHFRRIALQDTAMVVKNNNVILSGWKHFFQNQFPFNGYKGVKTNLGYKGGIKAAMITLAYARDIIYDPFNIIPAEEKPEKTKRGKLDKAWITNIAETQIYKARNKPVKTLVMDLIVGGLLIALMIMMFSIAWAVGHKPG